ncbi:2OG-Fe(II) oxygenase [Sphingomonas pseudosanguinis]|uniref:Prolyl 4-hydroxylase n=1 Tax=Sphingomonas pseudosanguinis TaxID=413712 RepID=A0A7W6A7K5_9SPHN|nr:2OG-Fe(II) oxygenase [Sphingomonas pseudosanguinis]MBB3878092.1 prolyl 4-hydroxylase [Sphingomonas pseudosanguinis]MBN3537961.1 2OG-Fe(II) oxygenase [Sphingomonas pseudosanguinis]
MATSPPNDPVSTARDLLQRARGNDALTTLQRAAGTGNIEAWYELALWRLIGHPVARDLPAARQALSMAAKGGHADAAMMLIALTANGSGGRIDWSGALNLLKREAQHHAHAAAVLKLVNANNLTEDGYPQQKLERQHLTDNGSVYYIPRFLSHNECDHIARAGADLFEPARVIDPATGRNIPHPIRTSDVAVIGPVREDLAIRSINLRIAHETDTAVDQGEALTLLRYAPRQQFRLHSDIIPGTRNQRICTAILYLNEGFVGGQTRFPDHDLDITPRRGGALIFQNVLEDGRPDSKARHAGLPVSKGAKWIATRWIRAKSFDPWMGPE